MSRLRTFCRAVAESPLLGIVLGVCTVIALGSAVAPERLAHPEKARTHWAAAPSAPCPLSLEAGREAKLVRALFDAHAPVGVAGLPSHSQPRVESVRGREVRHHAGLPDFGPLYRRPPPSRS